MAISIKNLSFSYGEKSVLKNISFAGKKGELVCMLGPNGVGKTTFFSCILGHSKNYSGKIAVSGRDIKNMSAKTLAEEIAYVPQMHYPSFNFTVLEVVLMGLSSRIGVFSAPKKAHEEKAMEALSKLGIADFAGKGYMNLSGGERQLVLIARALLQGSRILVLDEPTANLDFGNQARILKELSGLAAEGYFIIFSSHQPDHAYWYAHKVFALYDGEVLKYGAPNEVLDSATLEKMYGIKVFVKTFEHDGNLISSSIPG